MKHFIVEDKLVGQRLDRFLTKKTDQTRSQLKKAIEKGSVLVNDKKAKVHQFLKERDKVTFSFRALNYPGHKSEKELTSATYVADNLRRGIAKQRIPKIIKKTKDYLVVEKPSGMLVHVTKKKEQNTLVDWLVKKYPEIKKIGDPVSMRKRNDFFRPGIVHRLDREVSGLMLIARTQEAFEYFKNQFKTKKVDKEYLVLVHGVLEESEGTIDFEISRKTTGGRMASHPKGSGKGLPALTEYEVVERFRKLTLVKVKILTGRTNQIRVHFLALGHPVAGDELYCLKKLKSKISFPRIFLHAVKLGFVDLKGEQCEFESKLPEELCKITRELRKN